MFTVQESSAPVVRFNLRIGQTITISIQSLFHSFTCALVVNKAQYAFATRVDPAVSLVNYAKASPNRDHRTNHL